MEVALRVGVTAAYAVPQFVPQLATLPTSTQRYPAAPPSLRPSSQRPCAILFNTSQPVLKTAGAANPRGFESLPLRQIPYGFCDPCYDGRLSTMPPMVRSFENGSSQ